MRNLDWTLLETLWTPSSASPCHLCLQLCLGIDSISPRCWRRVFTRCCCWGFHSIKHRSKSPPRPSRLNSNKAVMLSRKTGPQSTPQSIQRRCQNPKAIRGNLSKRPRTQPIGTHSSAAAQPPRPLVPPRHSHRNNSAHRTLELWTRDNWQSKSFFSTSAQHKRRAMHVAEICRQPGHPALQNPPT